jgi:hypothetical protein
MGVLESLEHEQLESHSRSPGFESLCAHKKQVFLLEIRQKSPNHGVLPKLEIASIKIGEAIFFV